MLTGAEPAYDVLAVNRVGYLGGVERVILTGATAAAAYGWRTVLACPPGELTEAAARESVATRPVEISSMSRANSWRSPAALARTVSQVRRARRQVYNVARAGRVRVVHAHHPATLVQARLAAVRLKAPLIWHVHETAPAPAAYAALSALVQRHCALFVCVSDASRRMIRGMGAPEDRIRLIYNGVDPRFLASPGRRPHTWPGGPHIGIFGVLEPRKGHADLIRAVAALSGIWPRMQLWVVGGAGAPTAANYVDKLMSLAMALGVGDRIHFLGRISDVPGLMAQMDAVVCASIAAESLPTVLLEAAVLGVPSLTTDVGGAREIVVDGETGVVAPPAAPEALASALARLLSPVGLDLADRARRRALATFTPARFAADLDRCYRELATGPQELHP